MKAVIVADGEHAPGDRRLLREADLIVAADGGLDWLESVGVAPDRVIGDLDSASADAVDRLAMAEIPVDRHPADKDASDLELSIVAAGAAGADHITILGALGGALDHLLANVLLLGSPAADRRDMRLVHGSTMVRALDGPGRLAIEAPPGSRVSLFALGPAADGVTTRGLRWPLVGETLETGSSRGLGNVVDVLPAEVFLTAGRLLVVEIAGSEDGRA